MYFFVVLRYGKSCKKCVERYCKLANKTTQQLYKVSSPCIDDRHFKEEELKSVGELSKTCSQIVLKCFHLARTGRLDILRSLNRLARSITKWTKPVTNDNLVLFPTFITRVNTNNIVMCVILLSIAGWDCFKTPIFSGDLEDSKSTSGGTLCVLGKSYICSNRLDV